MNLETWLREEHPASEQLRAIESLSAAINAGRQKGTSYSALDPTRVEVGPDGACRINAAGESGIPGLAAYQAPEIAAGAPESEKGDIYTAGVIFYEVLTGRPMTAGEPVTPLRELRVDLPRDLTDAITACLETDPEWRPKDLSYILEVVRRQRGGSAPEPARAAAKGKDEPRQATPAKGTKVAAVRGRGANTKFPIFPLALVVVLLGAIGVWRWQQSQPLGPKTADRPGAATPSPATRAPAVPPSTAAATPQVRSTPSLRPSSPSPSPPVATSPSPSARPSERPTAEARTSPSPRAATPEPLRATPVPGRATPEAARATLAPARPSPEPARATPEPARPTPEPARATPAPALLTAQAAKDDPTPPPQPPSASDVKATKVEKAFLRNVAPPTLKSPSNGILDVHGRGLRAELQARFLKTGSPATGITVVRQRLLDPTLLQVVVRVDESVTPGPYGLALTDAEGNNTNVVVIQIAR